MIKFDKDPHVQCYIQCPQMKIIFSVVMIITIDIHTLTPKTMGFYISSVRSEKV